MLARYAFLARLVLTAGRHSGHRVSSSDYTPRRASKSYFERGFNSLNADLNPMIDRKPPSSTLEQALELSHGPVDPMG